MFLIITMLFGILPAYYIETDQSICTAIHLISFYMIFQNHAEHEDKGHR